MSGRQKWTWVTWLEYWPTILYSIKFIWGYSNKTAWKLYIIFNMRCWLDGGMLRLCGCFKIFLLLLLSCLVWRIEFMLHFSFILRQRRSIFCVLRSVEVFDTSPYSIFKLLIDLFENIMSYFALDWAIHSLDCFIVLNLTRPGRFDDFIIRINRCFYILILWSSVC